MTVAVAPSDTVAIARHTKNLRETQTKAVRGWNEVNLLDEQVLESGAQR